MLQIQEIEVKLTDMIQNITDAQTQLTFKCDAEEVSKTYVLRQHFDSMMVLFGESLETKAMHSDMVTVNSHVQVVIGYGVYSCV